MKQQTTKQFIYDLCARNRSLLACTHHGLYEVSLRDIYPHLNLDEAIVFEAVSWYKRTTQREQFNRLVQSSTLYQIFHEMNRIGFAKFARKKRITQRSRYESLNPFKGKNLEQRLSMVDPDAEKRLREDLLKEPKKYFFENDPEYQVLKRNCHPNLVLMHFQKASGNAPGVEQEYAAEISRYLRTYPRDIIFPTGPFEQKELF